jgi:hypothetical protein
MQGETATLTSQPMAHHTLLVIPAKAGIQESAELANVPYPPHGILDPGPGFAKPG